MVRVLHTSDWQIGMTRHFLAGEAQNRFTQERIDVVRRLAELAGAEGCDFAVVAGDVFETNQVTDQTVARTRDALAAFGIPIFLLPGNHDPLDAASVLQSPRFLDGLSPLVHVLADAAPRPVPGLTGVEVVGAPWSSKHPLTDLVGLSLQGVAACDAATVRVAVGHGAVDVLDPDRDNVAAIRLADLETALRDRRCQYVALGDRHSATDVGSTGAVRYSGAPEPTDFDEVRSGCALIVDVDASGTKSVREVEVGTWTFRDIDAEFDGPESIPRFEEQLAAFSRRERTVLRLALRGSLGIADAARLEDSLSQASLAFAGLQRWRRHDHLVVRPDVLDADSLGLTGYARRAWDELAAQDTEEARDALVLMHRLIHEERR
jgi:DNA repair exonuclease SbcCD nuclease subunit